jgi:DNA-binding response OmpR family regulator
MMQDLQSHALRNGLERSPREAELEIVVVTHDPECCRRLCTLLGLCGWRPVCVDATHPLAADPALVLLDADTVGESVGSAISGLIRADSTLPIVILAEFATSSKRARWIEAGARDVLTSSCEPREFLARIWRCARTSAPADGSTFLIVDPITIHLLDKTVWVYDERVSLTKTEFAILVRLLRNGFLTHEEILVEVLGTKDRIKTSKVRNHVANLRRKLGPAGGLIETVPPQMLRLVRRSPEHDGGYRTLAR